MNNNAKLRQWLTSNYAHSTLGITGRQIADAAQTQLKAWVEAMGGDPLDILHVIETATPTAAQVPATMTEAEKIGRAIQDAMGGGSSMDKDEVRDIIAEQLASEVAPSIEKIQSQVDALSPLADTLEKIADAMKGGTGGRLPLATAVASGKNPILELIQPYYTAGSANPTKFQHQIPT